ncbi:MAG: hypothetical protein IK006_08490 [Bacteroidaceae bacterium]|nr:hypothetical protein [Bacteroidaceae bacterium]
MKKITISVFTCTAMMLCGCGDEYPTYVNNYNTYEVTRPGIQMFTDYIEADGKNWLTDGVEGKPGFYVYQTFDFPEINDNVLENGAVLVYMVDSDGRDNILPYVFPVINENSRILMQNVRYDVEKGKLTLIIEWEDFRNYANPQEKFSYKVCILEPDKQN